MELTPQLTSKIAGVLNAGTSFAGLTSNAVQSLDANAPDSWTVSSDQRVLFRLCYGGNAGAGSPRLQVHSNAAGSNEVGSYAFSAARQFGTAWHLGDAGEVPSFRFTTAPTGSGANVNVEAYLVSNIEFLDFS